MLATSSRQLARPRTRGLRALRDWLWMFSHRARRYRMLRTRTTRQLRTGPMAIPAAAVQTGRTTDLVTGVGRRFPIESGRAAQFYRSVDDHE